MASNYRGALLLGCLVVSLIGSFHAYALNPALVNQDVQSYENKVPDELREIGIKEKLGAQLEISQLSFLNEFGQPVVLGDFFRKGKPVILTLVYYECPNICNFLLSGFLTSLKKLDWSVGNEFEVVTVSINPKELPKLAQGKKAAYIRDYGRSSGDAGWHFLTGEESQIRKLAAQVGFGYKYDEQEKQYAHSAVIFALTPEGRLSRYLYGVEFFVKDLKLALLEASNGKIGSVVDQLLLFCYRYDPHTRKYSVYLSRLMQAGCGTTLLLFGAYLGVFWRRQRKVVVR